MGFHIELIFKTDFKNSIINNTMHLKLHIKPSGAHSATFVLKINPLTRALRNFPRCE